MNKIINTQELRDAADRAHIAAEHFDKTTRGLQRRSGELDSSPFVGGDGETGAYKGQLAAFERALRAQFDEFVLDEQKFVAFLDGLHERIHLAAGIYDHNESENAHSFSQIDRALNSDGD